MSEKGRSIVLGRIAAWAYATFDRLQALFERLLLRAPSGRTEFFDPSDFPWIAQVEARADEIQAELDGLLAQVDKLPNFQDIQEEQRQLTQDDRWKVFAFYAYGGRADGNCKRCREIVNTCGSGCFRRPPFRCSRHRLKAVLVG